MIAGDDGRHYVFMHLQAGSIVVAKGAPVAAGQRRRIVGNTGASDGPHLHFEIWVNGWWATKASDADRPAARAAGLALELAKHRAAHQAA